MSENTIMKTVKKNYLEFIKYLDENKIEWSEIQEDYEEGCIFCDVNVFNKEICYVKNKVKYYKNFYYVEHEKDCESLLDLSDMFDSEY